MSKSQISTYCSLAALLIATAWTGWAIVDAGGLADGTAAPAYGLVGTGLLFAILIGLDALARAARFGGADDERDLAATRWGSGFSAVAYRVMALATVILLANAGLTEHANLAFLIFAAIEIVRVGLVALAYQRMS